MVYLQVCLMKILNPEQIVSLNRINSKLLHSRTIRIVKVAFDIYEEPDYKGNNQQFEAKLPEDEVIKIGNSKSNPVKSLNLGENVIFEARRVDNDERMELMGEMEDNNTGSGYYDVSIMVARKSGQVSEGIESVEGYRI